MMNGDGVGKAGVAKDVKASREAVASMASLGLGSGARIVRYDVETVTLGDVLHLGRHLDHDAVPSYIQLAVPSVDVVDVPHGEPVRGAFDPEAYRFVGEASEASATYERYRYVRVDLMPPELQRVVRAYLDLTVHGRDSLTSYEYFRSACSSLAAVAQQHAPPATEQR